jgi:hypothetical protein
VLPAVSERGLSREDIAGKAVLNGVIRNDRGGLASNLVILRGSSIKPYSYKASE